MATLRACWVTQAESGFAVAPARWTLLVPSSIHSRTNSVLRVIVSTVGKSQARMPWAWERRNSLHVGSCWRRGPDRTAEVPSRSWRPRPYPEFQELAPDPHVASPRVLPAQAEDQLANFRVEGRTPKRPMWFGPLPGHERPVPAEPRLGTDCERAPCMSREQPAR
jgi:hypothetical protein